MKVLNFGSLNLDYVYQVSHFVNPGETISASNQQLNCGGKGLNQSIALASAGANTYHAGCVGIGGQMLIEMLQNSGVDVSFVKEVDMIQGNAMIQVDQTGQNCIIIYGGSNRAITPEMIDEVLDNFDAGDYLVLQNEVSCVREMVEKGYERGMKIVLNPSPFDDSMKEIDYNKVTWLLVNEIEAEQLSGYKDPVKVWDYMHQQYPKLNMVVTLGSEGSMCFTSDKVVSQQAYKVKAVDTTGAGDTFTGYFIASLIEGCDLEVCMKNAAIASAISVSRAGAAVSIPKRDEVLNESMY